MNLVVDCIAYGYGSTLVAEDVSLELSAGEVLCLLGPNGAGKTSLFRALLGLLPLRRGRILLDGERLDRLGRREVARALGYVPQAHHSYLPYSARDVVLMGRTAHIGLFATPAAVDVRISEEALETVGVAHLHDRPYTELSGGEAQLVLVARALAQLPSILVMDEPTANLDFGNQVRVLGVIARLATQGLAVIIATHFPDHAFLIASQVALLQGGALVESGRPHDVITPATLRRLYGVDVEVITLDDGARVCVPRRRGADLTSAQ